MDKPDVDSIEGLSPAIAIEQKATSHNPRSTVGTVTEIYDYLRLLYARAGTPRCPDHGIDLTAQTVSQMVDQVLRLPEGTAAVLLAPVVSERKGEHARACSRTSPARASCACASTGASTRWRRCRRSTRRRKHTIEAVVDRVRVRADAAQRLAESFETALRLSGGLARLAFLDEPGREELVFSSRHACPVCGYSVPPLEPKLFSFNNPAGACPTCDGLGVQEFFDPQRVVLHPHLSLAGGAVRGWDRRNAHYFQLIQALARHYGFDIETPWTELPEHVRHVLLNGSGERGHRVPLHGGKGRAVAQRHPFEGILPNLTRRYRETESPMVREELAQYLGLRPCPECDGTRLNRAARLRVRRRPRAARGRAPDRRPRAGVLPLAQPRRLARRGRRQDRQGRGRAAAFLIDVGLDYLTLDRSAETLSGGEAQRIRLASQVGSGLTGVMYILDEPSIGLHQRDNRRLLATLKQLRDLGNTVIVVEHDEEAIRAADHVVDLGPGAGVHGGAARRAGHARGHRGQPRLHHRPVPVSGGGAIDVPRLRTAADPPTGRSASSARAATTCATSARRSRSGSSPASPACPARASRRSSSTRCSGTRPRA